MQAGHYGMDDDVAGTVKQIAVFFTERQATGRAAEMEAFTATLEACDPACGRFRAYRLAAGIDLLGDWLVKRNLAGRQDTD